jgi:hypothetical protein
MPPKQRGRGDHEGSPAFPRQEPTRRRQEQSVDRRDRRTRGLVTQDGKFMPEHNDFEFFEVVRATT